MKITLLCENMISKHSAKTCLAEWGFSAFIEIGNKKILFDTGHTEVFKNNANKLNINLDETDFLIFSHHHWDHIGGFKFLDFNKKKSLIAHPKVIETLFEDSLENRKSKFDIQTSKTVVEFSENLFFLGEIPRKNDFEESIWKGDEMLDDSAIAIKTKKGTVVITGCSHSGICNICEYAKEITGQSLLAVIGGFHLFKENQKVVSKTIEYFKKEKPNLIAPMHCVDFPTLAKMYSILGSKKYSTGDTIFIDS